MFACVCVCVCVFVCIWVSVSSAGCISGCEFPFPVSSPGAPPLPDDLCVVFVVELDKGPYGLGMGLIDGLVSTQKFKNRFYILTFPSVQASVFVIQLGFASRTNTKKGQIFYILPFNIDIYEYSVTIF